MTELIKLYILHIDKNLLYILGIDKFSSCGIEKHFCLYQIWTELFLSIPNIDNFLHIIEKNCPYVVQTKRFCLYYIQTICLYVEWTNCLYQIQTNITLSILHIDFFLYIIQTNVQSILCIKKCPYAIQTRMLLSIPDIDNLSLPHK